MMVLLIAGFLSYDAKDAVLVLVLASVLCVIDDAVAIL